MMEIVHELPEHVELSERLCERAPFYIMIQSFGIGYYIPGTPKIRQLLELNKEGKTAPRDRRLRWDNYQKADALREIVAALELQIRNVTLAGIEQDVTQTLLAKIGEIMQPTVRGMIDEKAAQLALPAPAKILIDGGLEIGKDGNHK